ncbi:peptidase family M20/M25/M40 protein [Plectosphaerella cucumerina]|uniref:Peptidase family M20/M25/M40 protein n=1 Tax=Plectosphaerella cucumerina TaxID=40658 RepID=A0A8K0X7N1_9PEZI|nr:peptidase family M20/M25/M40 protein [Plectosphaerella cucumerina]
MTQSDLNSNDLRPFEALKRESSHPSSRRARPPDLTFVMEPGDRIPLRAEKVSKRESKLGLRSIFGRSRASKDTEDLPQQQQQQHHRFASRFAGDATTPVTNGSKPLSNMTRSQTSLPLTSPSFPPAPTPQMPRLTLRSKASSGAMRPPQPQSQTQTQPQSQPRAQFGSWDPPPLFKAYPQAIKDAHLPATVMSADAILKFNEKRLASSESMLELSEDAGTDSAVEKLKWRHRRDQSATLKLDWTTKIFILCTSGYLLQYSGDGNFNRQPEKMLQLGKDSAAFVSDAIPGRHWVLQVSSVMEANGTAATDSRSILSRLPFVGSQNRTASNFLMVFESAEDMESWITILRREIEILGGKKSTSETGFSKADEETSHLKARTSQRTLVVRDPSRFSRVLSRDFSSPQMDDMDASGEDAGVDQSVDDVSTTNSIVSNDGRQLDSLRDSGNRLSYVSSGQRTIMTPTNSSPGCSPVRDSFNSTDGELVTPETALQPRPRPNAAAIMDRRQSMQGMNVMDFRQGSQPSQPYNAPVTPSEAPRAHPTPNFSVPISKRYSQLKTSPSEGSLAGDFARPLRARGPPPSAPFSTTRPLSIVADYPSPDKSDFSREDARTLASSRSSNRTERWSRTSFNDEQPQPQFPVRRTSLAPVQPGLSLAPAPNPRKSVSMHALRCLEETDEAPPALPSPGLPLQYQTRPHSRLLVSEPAKGLRRSVSSSIDVHERSSSPSLRETQHRARQRSSVFVESTTARHAVERPARYSIGHATDLKIKIDRFQAMPSLSSPNLLVAPGTAPMTTNKFLIPDVHAKALNRRSMPSLAHGPPPAPPPTSALPPVPRPPPTCALPPIPQTRQKLPAAMA